MGTWVIFQVWLLITQLVNVTETFTDIWNIIFSKMNAIRFAKCML